MNDDDGYPSEDELTTVRTWPWGDLPGLFAYLKERWAYARSRTVCVHCQTTPGINAISELRALIVLAIMLGGEDEGWQQWAHMARRKLEQMEMPP